jgi:hypothetical protein
MGMARKRQITSGRAIKPTYTWDYGRELLERDRKLSVYLKAPKRADRDNSIMPWWYL